MADQSVTIIESAPPAPPPAPTSEIHLTPPATDSGPKQEPPKPGSARDRMFSNLRKRAKPQFFEPREETPAQQLEPPASPEPPSAETPEKPEPAEEPTEAAAPPAASDPKAKAEPTKPEEKGKKQNPWKVVDEYKARAAKAESELLELKKSGIDAAKFKEFQGEIQNLKKQNEELEKEIRFTNYAKSAEFKSKYQEPYERSWSNAVKELSEVSVTDPSTGEQRAATVNDLAQVVALPLGQARDLADQLFGKFADDVMGYRKEIQQLYRNQEQALKEAKENGIKRDMELSKQQQESMGELSKTIKTTWESANQELLSDTKLGDLFKPVEGDQEGNQRLSKGFELVDRAFSENPSDPKLTAEQRAAVIKRHAAVRMRAAGFGRLRAKYIASEARVQQLEKELSQYRGSVPKTGGTSGSETARPAETTGWSGLKGRLEKLARH